LWSTGADVSAEDVGNYTCEVHGPHNALLASVTHRVFVAGPLLSVRRRPLCPALYSFSPSLSFWIVENWAYNNYI